MNAPRPGSLRSASARHLALAFLLALLAVLIALVTAKAYVAQQTHTTLLEFDRGSFRYTGLLDIPNEADPAKSIHSVQLLPIGLTGDWHEANRNLPIALSNLAAIANTPQGQPHALYVIGGLDSASHAQNMVLSTFTDLAGTLTPWYTENSLPAARWGMGVALYPLDDNTSAMYVVAGVDSGFNPTNTVFRSVVSHATGHIGPWTADDSLLPGARGYPAVVQHGGALYVMGGLDEVSVSDKVYCAPITGANGDLGAFSEVSALPEPLANGQVVVHDGDVDTLYFIGGYSMSGDDWVPSFRVYFADINGPCDIQPWSLSKGNLPVSLYGHSATYMRGQILLAGGFANSLEPNTGISSTVKAAIVDPTNLNFRLYDWCHGEEPPACTIGAWQTGRLLPQVRAMHAGAASHDYAYVIGGYDAGLHPSNVIYVGSFHGLGALYSPYGSYVSEPIATGQPAQLRRLSWGATIGHPGQMSLTMQYRYRAVGGSWSGWSAPTASVSGTNVLDINLPGNVTHVQYQASFTTDVDTASPLLDWARVYYEVPDPEVGVSKKTPGVTELTPGMVLDYTIYYTNYGGWVAEDVELTETLPEYTSYAGGPEWVRVGTSRVYKRAVGDVARGESGMATFRVRVNTGLPTTVKRITNTVEVDYPPMIDAFGNTIVDTVRANNSFTFGNPVRQYYVGLTKEAVPPPGTAVAPGSLITYTLHYENLGSVEASQLIITDTFDPENDYTVISRQPAATVGGTVWHLGTLQSGAEGDIRIVVRVNDSLPGSWPLTNQAHLKTLEGPVVHSEVLTHTTTVPTTAPDLTVEGIRWVRPAGPGSLLQFFVTVANRGNARANDAFYVELYIKPEGSGPPLGPWDHNYGYCLNGCAITRAPFVALVQYLDAGMTYEHRFDGIPLPGPGTYEVYAQVDMAFTAPGYDPLWGRYAEQDEANNLWYNSLRRNGSYLPAIFRRRP